MNPSAKRFMELDITKHTLLSSMNMLDMAIVSREISIVRAPVIDGVHTSASMRDEYYRQEVESLKKQKEEIVPQLEAIYSELFDFMKEEFGTKA